MVGLLASHRAKRVGFTPEIARNRSATDTHNMCDTVVVVRPEGVLFAKNSDRNPNEAQSLHWHPAADHPAGAELKCTWIRIPQARRTHAVLLSRPFWMWGAEMGLNEHGVAIGNEAVFTTQPRLAEGLTGMDLLRLALERAATASEAVEVIIELLGRHGQGGGCGHENPNWRYHSSFLVADAREAFVLETAGGLHDTERVTHGVRTLSNGLTIQGFAERHTARVETWAAQAERRRARSTCLAQNATSAGDLFPLLRDHGPPGPPRWSLLRGAMGGPCMHSGSLVGDQTTASFVCDLRPEGARAWATGTAAPCTSLFKPVAVDTRVELGPHATDRADRVSLWWRHERLHRLALRDLPRLGWYFLPERDAVEARWLADPPSSQAAFDEADGLLTEWTGRVTAADCRDRRSVWVRKYWTARNRRAGLQFRHVFR